MSEMIRSFIAFDINNETVLQRFKQVQDKLVQTGADLKLVAPQNIPIPTKAFRDLTATEAGHRALLDSAKALAMTAVDVLTDADLRQRMQREFEGQD